MQPIHLVVEKLLCNIPKISKINGFGLYTTWLAISSYLGILTRFNIILSAVLVYILTTDKPKEWSILAHTFDRDIKAIRLFIGFKLIMRKFTNKDKSVVSVFRQFVKQNPNKACILFENEIWTYQKVDEYANRVANAFRKMSYKKGDVVALMMENRAEYLATWLGLAKIGVVTSLINYNLKQQSLKHSINVCQAKAIIFSIDFLNAIEEVKHDFDQNVQYFVFGSDQSTFASSFSSLISSSSALDPPEIDIQYKDPLVYIYTSGTTGFPKAAIISHLRYFFISMCGNLGCRLTKDDRVYVPLPLYHSAGGAIGAGQAMCFNNTIAIRKKFSASQFWNDCIKYKCTVSQYIGETCRYLLAQPTRPEETTHQIRVMIGNGLRTQMWNEFVSRFRIKDIVELYGATEGNCNMANLDNTFGAVGFQPRAPKFLTPYMLIRVDKETGKPIRDENGLCIQCPAGEPGELVGRIDESRIDRIFDGYVNKSDSQKKLIEDVFGKGIRAFGSGDLLVMDKYGYFFFKDRLGDTFRWKGENVSTAEVESIVGNIVGLKEITVYGVEVPGHEGRAGMLTIADPDNTVNLNQMAIEIEKTLPSYARPIFVRVTDHIPMTSTFKLKKLELQSEGFDISKCRSDKLYLLTASNGYRSIDHQLYQDICNGKLKL